MQNKDNQKQAGMQSTTRDRARPRAAFVPRDSEKLSQFLIRVGVVMYGANWIKTPLALLTKRASTNPPPGSDEECYAMVRDQLITALRSGLLVAIVKLIVTVREDVRHTLRPLASESDDDLSLSEDDLTHEPAWFELDDGTPRLRDFTLKRSFWNLNVNEVQLDWESGSVQFSLNALGYVESDSGASTSIYDSIENINSLIYIRNPDMAIDKMFHYEQLPDEKWFSRYRTYRKSTRIEAIAAGWREIAICRLDVNTAPTELGRRMIEYLNAQGLETNNNSSEVKQAIREMAANMLDQLKAADRNSSILISSNVRKRAGDKG